MKNKDIFAVALKLFIITAVSALCLAAINKVTTPVIEKNNKEIEIKAQQELLPAAEVFLESEKPESTRQGITINNFNAGMKDGEVCGYVATVTSNAGYGGDIKVMVGIDKAVKVTNVKIIQSSETAGLGQNASKPEFISQYAGADSSLTVVKGEAKQGEISAISSATITSKAVTECVNAAIEAAQAKADSGAVEDTAKKLEEIKNETNTQILEDKGGDN